MSHKKYTRCEGAERRNVPKHNLPGIVSSLPAPIDLVSIARQSELTDLMVNPQVSLKLNVIGDQIKARQQQANGMLQTTRHDHNPHRSCCNLKRITGHVFHLYKETIYSRYICRLSQACWRDSLPDSLVRTSRLEADRSWTSVERPDEANNDQVILKCLYEHMRPTRSNVFL